MHNKSFTADGQVTIVGGRNIGAEYFGAREDVNFGDLDVIGVGPVASEVSAAFDSYWNSDRAVPADQLVGVPDDPEAEDTTLSIVDVAKHRNGPTGLVRLNFEDEITRFTDRARGGVDQLDGPGGEPEEDPL